MFNAFAFDKCERTHLPASLNPNPNLIYLGCILLSELGKHEEGLSYGRIAAKKCVN